MGRYEQLATGRSGAESRAREASKLTIPSLIPPAGATSSTLLPSPWQSVGARGVNNLAAKLLLALLPPGTSFFKLSPQEHVLDELKGEDNAPVVAAIQEALSKVERAVTTKLESTNIRPVMFEVFKHLIVGGNALLVILPDGSFKMFPLARYVVKRDLEGNPLEIITKEALDRRTLPPAAQAIVQADVTGSEMGNDKPLELFTVVARKDNGSWRVHQEILGQRIPGSEGFYPKDRSAWLPLRWTAVADDDYGRGMVEEYQGDLYSHDTLSQAIAEGAAGMARILFFADEAGVTNREDIQRAENLDILPGKATDITVLQVEKALDFSVAKAQAAELKQQLEQAFLLTSSIQRQAERVTAEEIRIMAAELEQSLGGVYSTFAQELQLPLIRRLMFIMQRKNELPPIPEKSVVPQIVTGLDGLGRSSDLAKLDAFLAGLGQLFGQPAVVEYVNVGDYAKRRAAALNIDTNGLVRSEEEVQAARQQAQQAQLAASLGPNAIKANADRDIAAMQQPPEAPPQ